MSANKIGTASTYQAQPTAITKSADGTSKTYRWRGDYAALDTFAASFTPESSYGGLTIRDVDLTPEEGGLATLVVKTDNIIAAGTGNGGGDTSPVYELEWQRVDKDIRNHPYWAALLESERDAIYEWEQDSNKTTKTAKYTALSDLQKSLAQRIAKGQTNYMVFVPVARKTSYTVSNTIVPGECGKQSTPPASCRAPAGYTYVKMADKMIRRSSGYERCEEWVGFDAVDSILFPSS
jgi:hypothetical protein